MAAKNTIQRQLLISAMKRLDHPTANEVYEEIRKDYPNISLGTVYRNLNNMVANGEMYRLSMQNSSDRFDTDICLHYHMCCESCGRYVDVHMDDNGGLESKAKENTGCRITGHDIIFRGICHDCDKGA
ncbi:MAG: Fur family transcriptional regulator [Christensenellales bacterium]|jgi:Fe2+ or Zn2+ uptake regulation protein